MNHEFIWLNQDRQYLLLDNGTWYDSSINFSYELGDNFLIGKIVDKKSYDQYVEEFPEVKNIKNHSQTDFVNGILVRAIVDGEIAYNYNPNRSLLNLEGDLRD